MKNIFSKVALGACLITSLHACSLDEYNPTMVEADETLSTFEGWKGMQSYCYQALSGYMFNFEFLALSEGGTDTWLTSINKTWAQEVFYYEGLASNTQYPNVSFKYAYSMINNCNAVINRAAEVKDGDAGMIEKLVAEVRCLRAYYYSVLVTHYGNITLNLTEADKINTRPQRNTMEEIYAQIIEDLKFAAEKLGTTPCDNNYARCTKKTALGLLARVYAQGAGEGLSENGVSYWQRAKEVSEDLINNASAYGAYIYDDVEDVWAQANNRNNKEALFIASGPNPYDASCKVGKQTNIFSFFFPNPYKLSDIYKTNDKSNYFYGRVNNNILAPSKYLIDCFDAQYDKRWENSFVTAFADFSLVQAGWGTYASKTLELTAEICDKYGISSEHVGKKIYPYADATYLPTSNGAGNQYPAKVWPKGDHSGNIENLQEVKNVYVHPYPLAEDEDRFSIYLSKEYLSDADKAKRAYACINIDDLFDAEGKYKEASFDKTNSFMMYPALSKYNWNYDGAFNGSNLQYKCGDQMIMRMAEVYLIAAEANQKLGNGAKAATYLNILRKRACRDAADFEAHMKLTTASEDDIFDEYARELCGEYGRWALLKRHKAFESRLAVGNPRAAKSFAQKHYLRPISYDFLSQIDNADEYGNNGY